MKRTALLYIVFALPGGLWAQRKVAAAAPSATQKASPQELFKRLSPSVVALEGRELKGGSVTALGSGVVIAPGEIVTNRHVVDAGDLWKVRQGERTWSAFIAWVDPDHDLALLKADELPAPAVSTRVSPTVAVGERVYAIGTPEGLEQTLSEGIVSGLREYQDGYVIQTSAPISPGSSGGGLFDEKGQLAGITTFGLVEGQNLNFALPASWVQPLLGVLPSRSAETVASEKRLNQKSKDTFFQADILLYNIATYQSGGLLPLPKSDFGRAASALYHDAVGWECVTDKRSVACIENWPVWQQASLLMLVLRAQYRDLQLGRSDFGKTMMDQTGSVWSDVSDVYCEDRPGGVYTDLEGKIRACPKLR